MKQLYRASIINTGATSILDGLDHYSQNQSRSPSLILRDSESNSRNKSCEYSVSTTYEFARNWTINHQDINNFSGRVIRSSSNLYSKFLIFRCILRFIIFEFAIFGAAFVGNHLSFLWFWLSINWFIDLLDWITLGIDLFFVDRKGSSTSRESIIKHHFSSNNLPFILDIVASIPLEVLFIRYSLTILLTVRLIKTLKIVGFLSDFNYLLSKKYNWSVYQHPISRNIFYSVCLFFQIMYIYAAIWYVIAPSFRDDNDMMKSFVSSIYYILVTMCAVGYGDIAPRNIQQVLLIVFVMITGFVILTNIIGSFVPYFFQSMIEEFEFTHRRDLIFRYLSKNGNDDSVKERTTTYFSNLWQKCRGLNDNAIFSKYLPLHLRREVGHELIGNILKDEKFFANAPESFLRCLCDNLEFGFYLENDIIFSEGTVISKLPILLSGDVEEYTFDENNKRIMLKSITDGRLFAQNEFISAKPIASNFESKTNGLEIIFIHRQHWNTLLKQYPMVAAQIFEYTNKRNNARGVMKSPQSKKLQMFSSDDDNKNKQKSIEGLYLPHSDFLQRWNMGSFIGLLMYIFFNSMLISFSNSRALNTETWCLLSSLWITDIFFVFDIYFRAKKFAVRRGESIISDPETVSKIYMKRDMYLDILSAVPLELILIFIDSRYMVLGRINRYIRLFRFTSSFGKALDFLNCTGSKRNIVLTCSTITIMLHLMGCLWYLVGGISHHVDGFEDKNWIDADPAISIESPTIARYLRCIYFAFLTSFTIGYGGIVPINFSEQLICMVLIIVGTSSYFIMMALITVWAEQANKIALNFERNFEIVKHVLSQLNVEESVNVDVRAFMSQLWSNQYGYRDETVLSLLPQNIRASIMESLSLGVLENITLFNNLPKGFMNELLLSFTIKSYCPNELLFSGNVVTHFFIVYQGTCVLKARLKEEDKDDKDDKDENDPKKRRNSIISQESMDSSTNMLMQTLQTRDYFGLEALDVFNQYKKARKHRARLSIDKKKKNEDNNDEDQNSEIVLEEQQNSELDEEIRNRKKRARNRRLSYYTSFENEEHALKQCPFDEFVIRADSAAFSTIIAITNDEFEEVLQTFPAVKANILRQSESFNVDAYSSSQSVSRQPSSYQQTKSHVISQSDLLKADELEITFGDNIKQDDDSSSELHAAPESRRHKQAQSLTNWKPQASQSTIGKEQMHDSNNFYEYFGLIHPLSDFKLCWNIVSLLFCLYNMMIIPYLIAFIDEQDKAQNVGFILIHIILDIFFCVDIYMRFDRFTFIEEGVAEPNKSEIRNKYVGYKLLLDVVSSVPWDFVVIMCLIQPSSWNAFFLSDKIQIYYWLRLVRLLRWHNFKSYIAEIDQFIEDRRIRIKPTMLRIMYQIIFVLIVCHWGASVFYFTAKETFNMSESWLRSEASPVFYDVESDVYQLPRYLLSAYWSLITMSSVGFGDIKPQTFAETCCGLVIMILGVLAYATTTAFIASFAAHANPPAEAFREKSQPIDKYLKTLKLSAKLKERSNLYFDELWKRFKGVSPLTAISCVSDSLQMRILESILLERLSPLGIFKDAPSSFIRICAQNMKHELYIQGEKIVVENTENYKMYLLFEGTARGVSGARDGRIYVAGTTFSKQALINTSWVEPGTIEAPQNCHCFTLKRDDFANIIASKKEWRSYLYQSNFVNKTNSVVKGNLKKLQTFSCSADEFNNRSIGNVDVENSILKVVAFIALVFNLWMNSFQFAFLSTSTDYKQYALFVAITDLVFLTDWIRRLLFVKSKNNTQNAKDLNYAENVAAHFKDNKLDFIVHILVLLPIDILLYFTVSAYCGSLFRFLSRLYHLGEFGNLMNIFIRKIRANPAQKLLIQMMLIIYLSLHNLSCIASCVANDEMFGILSYSNPLQHYLLAIYYVITVVTTTGYGDITPQNLQQIVFSMILIFCGNMIYAGTIGTISSWVGSTYARVLEHFNQLKELEAFCRNKKLNPQLSEKILVQHNESFNQRSRQQTLGLFPDRLQRQCSFEIYGKFIKSFEYFKYLASTQTSAIVRNIQTQTYLKGDVLFTRGDLNDKLHIIISGKVFLVKYSENIQSAETLAIPSRRSSISTGAWFGDRSFFMAQPAAVSAIAASDTVETMIIDRKVLLAILKTTSSSIDSNNSNSTPQKSKQFYQSLEKYFHRIEKSKEEVVEEIVENNDDDEDVCVPLNDEEVCVPLNDDEEEEEEAINQRPRKDDESFHPFIIFLEKWLSKNPHTNKKPILHAAQFWKLSVEAVTQILDEIEENQVTDNEQEEDEEEDSDEDDNNNKWIDPQVTFYDGIFDDYGVDSKRLREIKNRFKNHDANNTANCTIM